MLLRNSNFINVTLPGPMRFPQRTGEIFSSPHKILATNPIYNRIQATTIPDPPNSDHTPIQITLTTPIWKPTSKTERVVIHEFDKADWPNFKQLTDTTLPDINPTTTSDIDKYAKPYYKLSLQR